MEKPDHRHRLLRRSRQRPRYRRTAEKGDELPSFHDGPLLVAKTLSGSSQRFGSAILQNVRHWTLP